MTRPIKFRVWDEDNGMSEAFSLFERPSQTYRKGVEIMQFTGLHDKNGKEIYEGDVVKQMYHPPSGSSEESIYDVRFDCGCFSSAGADEWDIEVIGNIYENPELTK